MNERRTAIDAWVDEHAVRLHPDTYAADARDANRLAPIEATFADAKVVLLGETNHFIHEKAAFRLWWLRRLAERRRLVVVEELGWSDGRDVARYLGTGDESHLDRLATFGDRRHVRADRDDAPTGVLRASFEAYPTALFKAEQSRFYRGLRALRPERYYGIDIDAPGTGYEDVDAAAARLEGSAGNRFRQTLARVPGESLDDEAARLERGLALLPRHGDDDLCQDLHAMIETLRYTALAHPAVDYEALRPAMAFRETAMKRRLEWLLGTLDRRRNTGAAGSRVPSRERRRRIARNTKRRPRRRRGSLVGTPPYTDLARAIPFGLASLWRR